MNIYDKHSKAFSNVAAFVILRSGQKAGVIHFKYMPSGTVHCYFHEYGNIMVSGSASGCGYDKQESALFSALKQHDNNKSIANSFVPHFIKSITGNGQWYNQIETDTIKIIQVL